MTKRIYLKGDYVFPIDNNEISPKIPSKDETPRPINYICSEEIAQAMLKIVSKSFGITKESLYQLTAREFGFSRTGTNIVSAFDEAIGLILARNEINIVEDKISIND